MKSATISYAILGVGLLAPLATAQQPQRGKTKLEVRDAATQEDLAKKLLHVQANNPLANCKVDGGQDPTKQNRPVNIIEDSDIISFNGLTTLVPKRAILVIPDSVRNRIGKHVPGHRMVTWKEFHTANRGWISTVEVSRKQAEGQQDLPEAVTKRMTRSTNLMVATYQNGPISVLPPKQEETVKEADSTAKE
jgi:hypothetical protein